LFAKHEQQSTTSPIPLTTQPLCPLHISAQITRSSAVTTATLATQAADHIGGDARACEFLG